MVWCNRLGLTPILSTGALWQPLVLSGGPVSRDNISGASRRMGEVDENLVFSVTVGLQEIFNMSLYKNLLPWSGSNSRHLCPVASTLATTTPTRLSLKKYCISFSPICGVLKAIL
jgi:hypothetical protein